MRENHYLIVLRHWATPDIDEDSSPDDLRLWVGIVKAKNEARAVQKGVRLAYGPSVPLWLDCAALSAGDALASDWMADMSSYPDWFEGWETWKVRA